MSQEMFLAKSKWLWSWGMLTNVGLWKSGSLALCMWLKQLLSPLNSSIDALLAKFKLSLKQCRCQGYDGASNMRGELNGLKSLIMRDSRASYYVHCFARRLQLVIVATMRKYKGVSNFLNKIQEQCCGNHLYWLVRCQVKLKCFKTGIWLLPLNFLNSLFHREQQWLQQ